MRAHLPPGRGTVGTGGIYRRAAAAAAAVSQCWWLLQQPGSAGGSVRRGVDEAASGLLHAGGTGEEGAGGDGAALEGRGTGGGGSVRGEDLDVRARGGGGGGEAGLASSALLSMEAAAAAATTAAPSPPPAVTRYCSRAGWIPFLISRSCSFYCYGNINVLFAISFIICSRSFQVSPSLLPARRFRAPSLSFLLFFRTARAPGAKNNRGPGERRVPAARISGPEGG